MAVNRESLIRDAIDYGEARVVEARSGPTHVASEAIDTFAFNLDSYRSDGDIRQAVFNAMLRDPNVNHITVRQMGILLNNILSELHIQERD